jgi:hypothetical protein
MYINRLIALVALGAFGGLPGGGAALAGPSKQIRDWAVYCSDVMSCQLAPVIDSATDIYSIGFERAASANSPIEFSLSASGMPDADSDVVFEVPGVLERIAIDAQSGEERDGIWRSSDPRIASELIPALKAGDRLIVSLESGGKAIRQEISLSGSSAAMLAMDEYQDRVDKTDALVAVGSKPATGLKTRARELKSRADLPASVAAVWAAHPNQCAEGFEDQDLIASFGGVSIALESEYDDKGEIFLIPCGGPGAYNLPNIAIVHDLADDSARVAPFPTMSDRGPTVTDTITNASWDEQSGQVSQFAKGRGLGDCGTSSIWEWQGGGSYGNFVLIEERSKGECDGVYDDWPLTWPR